MNTQNKTALGLLVSGLFLFAAFGKSYKKSRLAKAGLKKVALQTWEGEGGALPVTSTTRTSENH